MMFSRRRDLSIGDVADLTSIGMGMCPVVDISEGLLQTYIHVLTRTATVEVIMTFDGDRFVRRVET